MCDDTMNFFEVIAARRSVRAYTDAPVSDQDLDEILEAVRHAPSAKNMQDWRFVVVRDAQTRRALKTAANNQSFVAEAPVVIACCSVEPDYRMRCGEEIAPIDLAIAIDHMTLAAAARGLGTCWIGSFYPEQVREILEIPPSVRIVELLTLGHPAEIPEKRPRLPREKIVFYEKWNNG